MNELTRDSIRENLIGLEKLQDNSLFNRVVYKFTKYLKLHAMRVLVKFNILKKNKVNVKLFWGADDIIVDMPAHADIFLYGCKVTPSDFLLQNYFNNFLKEDAVVYDIGASIGYYSLFIGEIVGRKGVVYSIEPSQAAFAILEQNTSKYENIEVFNFAIGDSNGNCVINEFPTRYNEFNTLEVDDFIEESTWFKSSTPIQNTIPMKTLDAFIEASKRKPDVVKIDIEGSEELFLNGMLGSIVDVKPDLIFRYWPDHRDNSTQLAVFRKLIDKGYEMYSLENNKKIEFNNLPEYKFEYVLLKKNLV